MSDEKVTQAQVRKDLSSRALKQAFSRQLQNKDGKFVDSKEYPVERIRNVQSAYLQAMKAK